MTPISFTLRTNLFLLSLPHLYNSEARSFPSIFVDIIPKKNGNGEDSSEHRLAT
jgi:hypothetical protein